MDSNGRYSDLSGGSRFQFFSTALERCLKVIPPEANVFSYRKSLPIFGDGLIEAIPDAALLTRAAANSARPDGIGGRAHRVQDAASGTRRVGRFGWKAQQATLLSFAAEALRDEMGVTNDLFPREPVIGLADPQQERDCDGQPDPEDKRDRATGLRKIDHLANFMRMLAPPPRGPQNATTRAGETLFEQIGCAACHVAEMTTGPGVESIPAGQPVRLYSDLLLHDIGTGDGVPQGDASGDEYRTPPLWGLRVRRPFLHDGRAPTIEAAIRQHGRQAAKSRQRFVRLNGQDRAALLAFLDSL